MYDSPFLQAIDAARAAARASGRFRVAELLDAALMMAESERQEALAVAFGEADPAERERALSVLSL
jgi:hypothetical protein